MTHVEVYEVNLWAHHLILYGDKPSKRNQAAMRMHVQELFWLQEFLLNHYIYDYKLCIWFIAYFRFKISHSQSNAYKLIECCI